MSNKLNVKILTLFPEIFPGSLGISLAGQALINNIWSLEVVNIRDFGLGKHKTVDDEVFGGGNGLLMRADVLGDAIDYAINKLDNYKIIYLTPRGKLLTQNISRQLSEETNLIFICGRFEGIDERVIDEYNICEISIGDFVLSGGELASMVVLDSIVRLLPGVLANQDTLKEESFSIKTNNNSVLLEYPQYTRPQIWRGRDVPEVLRSGNHKLINEWRTNKSEEITKIKRPDLLKY
jgi:tRNA (guanine37-N1)-methyltransferase